MILRIKARWGLGLNLPFSGTSAPLRAFLQRAWSVDPDNGLFLPFPLLLKLACRQINVKISLCPAAWWRSAVHFIMAPGIHMIIAISHWSPLISGVRRVGWGVEEVTLIALSSGWGEEGGCCCCRCGGIFLQAQAPLFFLVGWCRYQKRKTALAGS